MHRFITADSRTLPVRRLKKAIKKEKTDSSKKVKFSELLKAKNQTEGTIQTYDFPPEIADMEIEDAAVFLRDAVDHAGNDVEIGRAHV